MLHCSGGLRGRPNALSHTELAATFSWAIINAFNGAPYCDMETLWENAACLQFPLSTTWISQRKPFCVQGRLDVFSVKGGDHPDASPETTQGDSYIVRLKGEHRCQANS